MKNIEQIRQRTYRYFYEDGLVEIAVGMLFIFVGLMLLIFNAGLQQSPVLACGAAFALFAMVIGAVLTAQYGVNQLKERVTYPRTGYVSYPNHPSNTRWIVVSAALILGIGVLLLNRLVDDFPAWLQHISLMEGWLLGIILATIGYSLNIRRFYILGALALLAGLLTAVSGLDDITASTLTFSLAGLALMLSGGKALTHYLRENASSDEEHLP